MSKQNKASKKALKRRMILMVAVVTMLFMGAGAYNDVYAEEATTKKTIYQLEEVLVEGEAFVYPGSYINKKARYGILGYKDILDIPYTEISLTSKSIETFSTPSLTLNEVLTNIPSIRSSTSSPMYTDFSMRGINMNGNHMYLNGIPNLFYQFTTPPAHIIERIDVTVGPNAGINGATTSSNGTNSGKSAPPGVINVISKRAGDEPVTRYTQTFSGRGSWGEYIDIGRRFGKNQEWGIRVNTGHLDGDLSLAGTEKQEKTFFINLNHRDDRSTTNLLAGYFDLRVNEGQRWFILSDSVNKGLMPKVPNAKNSYDFPETTKYVHGYLSTLNHEQKINDNWHWYVNTGMASRSGTKYNSGSALYIDGYGKFLSSNKLNHQNEASKNVYIQTGVNGDLYTGQVKHNMAFSVDRAWTKYWNKSVTGVAGLISGNLYDGIVFADYTLPEAGHAPLSYEETVVGATLADTMEYKKMQVLLAGSRRDGKFKSSSEKVDNLDLAPSFGITYKPIKNIAFYTGYSSSYSRGVFVSDTKYENKGAILSPVKNKQTEVGVKYENRGLLTTLSYFDLNQGNYVDLPGSTSSTYILAQEGENSYRGVELTINGKIAERWNIAGGLMHLDHKREKTGTANKDGWYVNGVSDWSSVIALEYNPDDKTSVIGHANYNSSAYIDDNKAKIPSYVTFDLGVSYKTEISATPVKLSAMCYNVADKSYWMGRGGSTTFGLSMPRTITLTAQFDL